MVLPVLPDVPLPSVDALLVAVGEGAVLPVEPLLPVDPLPVNPLPVEPLDELPMLLPVALLPVVELPILLLPVEPAPVAPAGLEALPILLPVEPLPVEPELGPVLPGMFLFVSTMMISFKKSTIKHPKRMRFKGGPVVPAANLWTSRVKALATC